MKYLYSRRHYLIFIFLFCASLIVTRWYRIPVANSTYPPRSACYGDCWSSLNVYSAARHFKDFGFMQSYALPVFGYTGHMQQAGTFVYTHYPPLPDELAGLFAIITGSDDIRVLALLPMMVSCLFFCLIFYTLQRLSPNKTSAFLAATFTVISCYFISWADDLHQHTYGECCKWLYVLVMIIYYEQDRQKTVLLWVMAALYFINSYLSYEGILYYAVVTVGCSLIYTRRLFSKENVILLFVPVLGYFLHMCQNYFYFKSWQGVFNDIRGQYLERAVGDANVQMNAEKWGEIPGKLDTRFTRTFFINTYSFIILAVFGFRHLYTQNRKYFWLGWVLLLASIVWIFFMPQHAYIHLFTIRHFGFFYAFILCAALYAYGNTLMTHFRERRTVYLALHTIFILFTVGTALYSHFFYVYLKYGYGFPSLGINHNLY
jgi:hypothetical protein